MEQAMTTLSQPLQALAERYLTARRRSGDVASAGLDSTTTGLCLPGPTPWTRAGRRASDARLGQGDERQLELRRPRPFRERPRSR